MGADTVVDMEVTNPVTVAGMEVTEAPMENTIWRMKKGTKQQKIPKDTKSPNSTTPMLTTIFIKFMTMWMPETTTKLTTFKSKSTGICKTKNTNTSNRNTE